MTERHHHGVLWYTGLLQREESVRVEYMTSTNLNYSRPPVLYMEDGASRECWPAGRLNLLKIGNKIEWKLEVNQIVRLLSTKQIEYCQFSASKLT